MYKAYLNGNFILHSVLDEVFLINPQVALEINNAGSFEFTVAPSHSQYNSFKKMKSEVTVTQNGKEIFCGRVTQIREDFFKRKKVYCEGELAYLNDSVQRPAEYHDMTVRGYLEAIINIHNAQVEDQKKFYIGVVTVTDNNDSIYRYTNWENTLSVIKKDLVDSLGGYIFIRKENGKRYIDYLKDFPNTSTQAIEFGKNLLDFTRNFDATDIATAIIPLGAKQNESEIEALGERLTIKEINGGNDFVYSQEAVDTYGWIFKTVTWDNVNTMSMLKKKGEQYLSAAQFEEMVIEAKAIDLNFINGGSEQFKLGDKIRVVSAPHGLDKYFPLTKMTVYLDRVSQNTVTLGTSGRLSLTAGNIATNEEIQKKIDSIPSKSEIVKEAVDNATALINQKTTGYVTVTGDELLIMDTKDKETATKVWRWNLNGLGYSSNGYKGPFETAITMDGQIVGKHIAANSISGEKLDITYRKELDNKISNAETNANSHTDNALKSYYTKTEVEASIKNASDSITLQVQQTTTEYVKEQLTGYATTDTVKSQIKVVQDAITAEVSRAKSVESDLNSAIGTANNNLRDFQTEVNGTFRDGVISETEAMSIERYLNMIEKDYQTVISQYDAILTSAQIKAGSGSNLKITFSSQCATESGTYDYVSLYYVKDGAIYQALSKGNGETIAGKSYIIPSLEFYLYWHSDSSNCNYYGFSVDSITRVSDAATATGTSASLPSYEFIDTKSAEALTTSHPYTNNENKMWHYKDACITKSVLTSKKNTYTTAYNNLKNAITSAIGDSKVTSAEVNNVNTKFSSYSEALAALKEALEQVQLDVASRVTANAYARLKITEDAITAEVARATEQEGTLKSLIQQTADSITLEVSKKYATTSQLTEKYNAAVTAGQNAASAAESNAKADTANKLKSYPTTVQMSSAIKQSADSISLEVSKKVGNDEIISAINASTEQIKIKASVINLEGNVSITALTASALNEIKKYSADAETNAKQYTLSEIAKLPNANGNLVNGYAFSADDIKKYWDTAGTITTGISDPMGGNKAAKISADASDCYISAKRTTNKVINATGRYTVSVWLRASKPQTIQISFNRATIGCSLTTSWKKFSFVRDVTTVASSNQLLTIGGWGSIASGDGSIFVYNPEVTFGYTSQEIFNMLTNNGETQGLVLTGGKVYLNGEYIQANTINASALKAGSITADKLSVEDLYAVSAKIGGWVIGSNYLQSTDKNVTLYSSGKIKMGSVTLQPVSNALTVKYGLHVYAGTSTFSDGTDQIKFFNLSHVTSGGHLVFASDGTTLSYLSSSSKRYKNHISNMTLAEAKKILGIPVVWFQYKDGYLNPGDWLNGKSIPGFYAEDVYNIFPEATQLNIEGEPEDWNFRVLIPAMLKLIQNIYERANES